MKNSYEILSIDPYLESHSADIALRMRLYDTVRKRLLGTGRKLSVFADGARRYGFHRTRDGWVFREWLPGADEVWLCGDFNGWNQTDHPMTREENGVWSIRIPGFGTLRNNTLIQLRIRRGTEYFCRIPAYIRCCYHDPDTGNLIGKFYAPERNFEWTDRDFGRTKPDAPMIYEAHIGMAQEEAKIGSYREFADFNLEYIHSLGYNVIQLMGIQEHPYYASYGYQVTNFYAVSSRFGTPDDLKYLINKAHSLGIFVVMDLVHSHSCTNIGESLNLQDGTEDQYFHTGKRGRHPAWKTLLFNYGKDEVLHFLLSNLKFFIEEYHFDGFRFDGVTSMIYQNHGLGSSFTDYNSYFSLNTNVEALTYLQLANELIHEINPFAITIAEDVSGMPGMCLPIKSGGIGFDYRLSMGIPDLWVRLIRDEKNPQWDMFKIWYELTTRRPKEKSIGYCESHDQAMMGDKTLIFRMADAAMYDSMHISISSPVIDRAIDFHKVIRFATITLGGDGYLNFMGNEFGHPEWIDFPREGNGNSYLYARRQWSLAFNPDLKYRYLLNFDREMIRFVLEHRIPEQESAVSTWIDPKKKILSFAKGDLLFVINLNENFSDPDFFVYPGPLGAGRYRAVFSSDLPEFGGQDRVSLEYVYSTEPSEDGCGFPVYIPCRCAVVFQKVSG